MDNFDWDTLQTVANVLASIFGAGAGVLSWLVNILGTVSGWLVAGLSFLIGAVGGWLGK